MQPRARLLVAVPLLLLSLVGSGCAPAVSSSPEAGDAQAPTNPNLLTEGDLRGFSNASQAVLTLRTQWLRTRAAGGFNDIGQQVWVYQDGVRLGGPDTLAGIQTPTVQSIRYYDGLTASGRWGLGHENGVIYVTTKSR